MRSVFLRLTAVAVLAFAARSDAEAAFCASYFNGGTNCGFATFQQCLESVRGVGGQCGPAPGSAGEERRRPDRPEARPRREPERKPAAATPREAPRREAVTPPPQQQPIASAPPVQIVTPPATDTFAAARALILSRKYQQAIDVLRALRDDTNPDVAASVGYASSKLGRLDEAKLWLDRALTMNPDHLWAVAYSGMLRVQQGDVPSAQRDLEKVAALCGGTGCVAYRELAEVIASRPR
jgi:tetratricopeptide (TPR) repeat protein